MGSGKWQWCVLGNGARVHLMSSLLLVSYSMIVTCEEDTITPGCFLEDVVVPISIPGCPIANVTLKGCGGYCFSRASSTTPDRLHVNPDQKITSEAKCCDMDSYENYTPTVECYPRNRQLTFAEAKSCSCSQCTKS